MSVNKITARKAYGRVGYEVLMFLVFPKCTEGLFFFDKRRKKLTQNRRIFYVLILSETTSFVRPQ